MSDNLILIGFSGSGKSSVGRVLARRLAWPFVDTDAMIVERFGMPIANLFREQGEAVFRAAERDAVASACSGCHQVISLGGGAPLDPTNRRVLTSGNRIVRLDAAPEELLRRLRAQGPTEERPLLGGPEPLVRIQSLLASRAEAYAIATLVITTDGRTPEEVADEILRTGTCTERE